VPKSRISEVEMANEKSKRYKSPCVYEMPAELIQAEA
jgi:hypothetical protein